MEPEPRISQHIGANADENLAHAMAYYRRLSAGPNGSGGIGAAVEADLAEKQEQLERALQGFDSFDTLAFLRVSTSNYDLSTFHESETVTETSQAAQDVVALCLLKMGLPRTPLTGSNTGQPDPQKLMTIAADIIRAAQFRALRDGRESERALGVLAGEFRCYEISVRGRQYNSIAAELNNGILNTPPVESILKKQFGFSLDDIRAVREASVELMQTRFFGIMERIAAAGNAPGTPTSETIAAAKADFNAMVNECRLFGAINSKDVAASSAVNAAIAESVLAFFSTKRLPPGSKDPLAEFAEGRLVRPWGCIADDGEYLLLNDFMAEDEIRRGIEQRLTMQTTSGETERKAWTQYEGVRATFTERSAAHVLQRLLGDSAPIWQSREYLFPESLDDLPHMTEDADLSTIKCASFESDTLFVVDNVAFCVEVKAGSVTSKSRSGNIARLTRDLETTLKGANTQATRLAQLISTNHGIWTRRKEWIDLSEVLEIHPIVVMLDDMGPLSLSMNELANQGIIKTPDLPWIVSLHDLHAIARTLEHPSQFLAYVRRRRGRKLATKVSGSDELDMFMWFLNGGMYFEPDPKVIADQLPIKKPMRRADQKKYDSQDKVRLGTLTDPLDSWFYSHDYGYEPQAKKPVRKEMSWVEQFLKFGEESKSHGWLRFGADLVGLSEKGQRDIGKQLASQRRAAHGGNVERSLTTHAASDYGSWLLTLSAVPPDASTEMLPDYLAAKQYQTRSDRAMLVFYSTDGEILETHYRAKSQDITPERDAAVADLPLFSLESTFRSKPPLVRSQPKKKTKAKTKTKNRTKKANRRNGRRKR